MAEYGGGHRCWCVWHRHRLAMFMAFVVMGLDQGMLPIAGYNFGAQKFHRLESVVKYTLVAATVVTTLSFAASHLFPGALVGLFVKDAPELAAAGEHGLRVVSIFLARDRDADCFLCLLSEHWISSKEYFPLAHASTHFPHPSGAHFASHFTHFLSGAAPIDGVWYSLPAADGVAALISVVMLVAQIRKLRQKSAESV